jgi:ATP-binding cassette, subfamily B, beta-glucan exporter
MTLALPNLVLASTQFAEPVLSGKVIDTISRGQAGSGGTIWPRLFTLPAIWGFVWDF